MEEIWNDIKICFQSHYFFQFYPQQIIMFVNDTGFIPKMYFINAVFHTTWELDNSTAKSEDQTSNIL